MMSVEFWLPFCWHASALGSACLRDRGLLLIWAYHMCVLNLAAAGGRKLGLFVCYAILWGITITYKLKQSRDDRVVIVVIEF